MSDKHLPFGKPEVKDDEADDAPLPKHPAAKPADEAPTVAARPAPAVRKVETPKVALGDLVLYYGANGSDYHAKVLEDHGNGELKVKVNPDQDETGYWFAVVNFADKYTEGHWNVLPKKEVK